MKKEKFLEEANKIHNNKYRYEIEEDNIKLKEHVKTICPVHGEFNIIAYEHIRKHRGCPKCAAIERGNKQTSNTDEFIKKAKELHGNKYDYTKVEYVNSSTKVCIICPEHGVFWQTPNSHLNGRGCPKCAKLNTAVKLALTTDEFIKKAKEIHKDKFRYDKVVYINKTTPIIITCPIHGEVLITPQNHLKGCGCPKCRYDESGKKQMLTTDEFIKKAKELHGDKYDYSDTEYKGYEIPVKIICPKHGEFLQTPDCHLHSGGCPICGSVSSKGENEILELIKSKIGNENVLQRDRKIINGYEIDIYIPSRKIAIEYNGILWHSERYGKDKNYHLDKTIRCKNKNINLIQIFEDEYLNHKDIVISKVLHQLHLDNEKPRIGGRKCEIKEINKETAKDFLNRNHIQGYAKSSVQIGAFYKGKIVGVMQFKHTISELNKWELTRFATDINFVCQGVGGRLFNYFIKKYSPEEVKTFADRRWTFNEYDNLYTKIGFKLDNVISPTYSYYCQKYYGMKRVHKFNFRKNTLNKKFGFPLTMTEEEMAKKLCAYKVWDCGLFKYIWKK